jgi:outer membrane receptor protein involved in Fe transport
MQQRTRIVLGLLLVCALFWPTPGAFAQGVTTGSINGIVNDAQGLAVPGASVTAVHVPSGTTYEAVTRADGRFTIPGMRVGGPYTVTASLAGFQPQINKDIVVNLGGSGDLVLTLRTLAVSEEVTVTAQSDAVFSSGRTGAVTSVSRDVLASIPTFGRLSDVERLTPQASGTSFAGQDNRLNNITVDGSYFNNSFGLSGQPGDRTGVAAISLESIEQIQVSVAPFDVRQGNFVGAGVNTVTRSGTNRLSGSMYHRFRNESFVGTEAKGLPYNPGTFNTSNTGGWAGGPVLKNKLFAFGNYEDESDARPLTTFTANAGGEPVGGSKTRVLASDLDKLSALLKSQFSYESGPYSSIDKETPAKRFLFRTDYNLAKNHKVSFRYNYLDSITDVLLSTSSSLGFGRSSGSNTTFLGYQNSNYQIMENIKSGIGEWNWVIGNNMANSLITGYTTQDESRNSRGALFPFVDILDGSGTAYTSFGFEPFTPNNELRYQTFQLQDNFTRFSAKHTLTFGGSLERYKSENVFFPGKQSAYVYNTLADFYADAADYAANPNRTVSPITLRRFQVRYTNIPGQEKPVQPLAVWYSGAYAQDEWRPKSNLTVTAGIRFDVPVFGDTAYQNANVDALTFRDETGAAVQYQTGKLPDPKLLWSPRVGVNWDVKGDKTMQVRGGTGVFTGRPAYVWISNQIGNTGVLTGFEQLDNITSRPFSPNVDKYKPATVTGAPAVSVDLAVTDPNFSFPQVWRSNIAVDQRLPWGFTGTAEYLYNKDVNGVYYINANLPATQSSFVGADNRPRWVGTSCSTPTVGGCVTRINNTAGNVITNAIVLKNQNVGRSWNFAATLAREMRAGLAIKGVYSYGTARNTIDPGSIASGSFTGNPQRGDPNNPGLGYSGNSAGHRVFVLASYTREYFNFGATTVSVFWEARTIGNTSYLFSGDLNGDTATNNDLIYVPKDQSEMNFAAFTVGTRAYTAADQAAAFDAYISQDKYLSTRRGQYAERGAVFLPFVKRIDLSVTQDLFTKIRGTRNAFQFRLDIANFGNMLNHDWGVSQRVIRNAILTNPAADALGRATYRMVLVNGEFPTKSYESTVFSSDVYSFMISLRYTFN